MSELLVTLPVVALLGAFLATFAWLTFGAGKTPRGASARRERDPGAKARVAEALRAPGGSPENPIVVVTSSVIDDQAKRAPCVRCSRDVDLRQHRAVEIDGARLRAVEVECRWCGFARTIYFRISESTPSVLH